MSIPSHNLLVEVRGVAYISIMSYYIITIHAKPLGITTFIHTAISFHHILLHRLCVALMLHDHIILVFTLPISMFNHTIDS